MLTIRVLFGVNCGNSLSLVSAAYESPFKKGNRATLLSLWEGPKLLALMAYKSPLKKRVTVQPFLLFAEDMDEPNHNLS